MSFGSRLREKRKEMGLKQSELGNLLGVTGSAIGNYENDFSSPKADILYKVFEVLHCDANFLFQDEIKSDPAANGEADERKERLIKNYDAMNDEGRDALTKLSDDMIAGGRYKPGEKLVTYRLVARNGFNNVQEVKGKDFDPDKVEGIKGDDF